MGKSTLCRSPLVVLVFLTAALAACQMAAAEPSRAAVTLGSDLTTPTTGYTSCKTPESTRGCLAVDTALPGRELVAPFQGVIVRWRVRLGENTEAQSIRIRVVRQFDANRFTVISSGKLESIPAGASTETFPAQLPIAKGDQVGLESDSGTDIEWSATLPGAHSFLYSNLPPDGGLTAVPVFDNPNISHTFNVDVEPDCDGDGLGDETQDPDTSSCRQQPQPPSNAFTLGKPKLNKKNGTAKLPVTVPGPGVLRLSGSGVVSQSAAARRARAVTSSSTVKLLVKAKGKKKRQLNEKGKTTVKVTVAYTPTGGTTNSKQKKLTLRKRLRRS